MSGDMDQRLASVRDFLPRMWWSLYSGAILSGFTEPQAFILLQTWILAQNPNGIRPPDGTSLGGNSNIDKD